MDALLTASTYGIASIQSSFDRTGAVFGGLTQGQWLVLLAGLLLGLVVLGVTVGRQMVGRPKLFGNGFGLAFLMIVVTGFAFGWVLGHLEIQAGGSLF